jgi:hypothetical protein
MQPRRQLHPHQNRPTMLPPPMGGPTTNRRNEPLPTTALSLRTRLRSDVPPGPVYRAARAKSDAMWLRGLLAETAAGTTSRYAVHGTHVLPLTRDSALYHTQSMANVLFPSFSALSRRAAGESEFCSPFSPVYIRPIHILYTYTQLSLPFHRRPPSFSAAVLGYVILSEFRHRRFAREKAWTAVRRVRRRADKGPGVGS